MKKMAFLLIFILLIPAVSAETSWISYGGNPSYQNYIEGSGNISYPIVAKQSEIRGISRTLLAKDINLDGKLEIVGASLLDNTLYVFDSNLSVLWDFKETGDSLLNQENISFSKITAVAAGNISGDSTDEILFSISHATSNKTILHAFDSQGNELWRKDVEGKITQQSLFVADIDNDGINEIICGGTSLNILYGNGTEKYKYDIILSRYNGVSEIIFARNEFFIGVWSSSSYLLSKNSNFYRSGENFTLIKMKIQNKNISLLWEKELDKESYSHYVFQSSPSGILYITNGTNTMYSSIEAIDPSDGNILWTYTTAHPTLQFLPFSIDSNSNVFWSVSSAIISLYSNGKLLWQRNASGPYTPEQYADTIALFDVDNDGSDEVIAVKYKGEMECLDEKNGELKWKINIYQNPKEKIEYFDYVPVILHSDTDNDGFDEIITTDPEGRIVIIDSGTPPNTEEPETIAGMGTIGMAAGIMTASALIWIWRKRRNEK